MNDKWATPQKFFDKVNAEFGFDVDVCALPETAKCELYFTPEVNGLAQEWKGSVWCNPPYGKTIGAWLRKAYNSASKGATVVCLVPTRTNAPWWHDYAMHAHEIRFVIKKLGFDGPKDGVPFTGHALLIFRPGTGIHNPRVSSWEQ
jgi:phage N-6-adenine-methyltransferase